MLKWKKDINGYNGHWMGGYIGFDDDCPLYKVGEDDNGWYYDYLPSRDGMDGYNTAEEAMTAAEADYQHWYNSSDDFDLEIDSDLLEKLATEAEVELQGEGLERWMNSDIYAKYHSDWE